MERNEIKRIRNMNLFDKSKSVKTVKTCQNCSKEFKPDKRNVNRGWSLCCSKSCAASYKNKLKRMTGRELVKEVRDMRLSQLGI
jgi:hypothetical protein